jgi:hypothetical protein
MADSRKCALHGYLTRREAQAIVFRSENWFRYALAISQGRDMAYRRFL